MSFNIPLETIEAYRCTRYDVFDSSNIISLRIGELSTPLADVYHRNNVQTSVFITAWNPLGVFLSDQVNEQANHGLRVLLAKEGIKYLEGAGVGTDTAWPPEKSLLALGVSNDQALALCSHFKQNAVVFIGADCIPALMLHPDAVLAKVQSIGEDP